MTWINRKDQEPPIDAPYILVWGKVCNCPHIAFRDYDDWLHVECCYEDRHFSGGGIEFDFWQPAPDLLKINK